MEGTKAKNLMIKGEISGLIIQSLKTIGQNNTDEEVLQKLIEQLKNEQKEIIIHDAKLAPAWINKILMNSIN